jgi:hypothetical protein
MAAPNNGTLALRGGTDRGGVFVHRPEHVAEANRFTFRSRWTTNVHQGDHTTVHISPNADLAADEVSFAPFGGETRVYGVRAAERIPADGNDPSPDVMVPIEVAPEDHDEWGGR